MDLSVQKLDVNGFIAKQEWGRSKFLPPCVFYSSPLDPLEQSNVAASSAETKKVEHSIFCSNPFIFLSFCTSAYVSGDLCRCHQPKGRLL